MEGKTKTAEEVYKANDEEFCKGSTKSKLNTLCKTTLDVIVYSMEIYAKQEREKAVNEYKEKIFKLTKHLSMTGNIDLMSDAAKINALIEKLK